MCAYGYMQVCGKVRGIVTCIARARGGAWGTLATRLGHLEAVCGVRIVPGICGSVIVLTC